MKRPINHRSLATGLVVSCVSVLAVGPAHGEVSALGDYTTNIAIEVPPLRGIAPSVNLAYSSSGGNSHVGVGWRLDATSAIMRTGARGGIPLGPPSANDRFVLDGEELIACQPGSASPSCTTAQNTHGSSVGYYSTRRESFSRLYHAGGTNTWTMWLTDGRTARFETFDAGQSWLLTHSQDRHGNALDYTYVCDPGQECQLDSIKWGETSVQARAEVHFYYEARPDKTQRATGTGFVVLGRRLRSITVSAAGSLVRAYALTYQTASTSGRSILTSVQQFGRDAYVNTTTGQITAGPTPPLPPTTFATAGGGTSWRSSPSAMTGAFSVGDLGGVGPVPRHYIKTEMPALNIDDDPEFGPKLVDQTLSGDFDGDGRADVANVYISTYCEELGIQGRLTRKGGSLEVKGAVVTKNLGVHTDCNPTVWVADINGDHRDDLLYKFAGRLHAATLVGGRFRKLSASPPAWTVSPTNCGVGDIDGDQRDDLVCLADPGGGVQLITARSRGDGSFTQSSFLPQTNYPLSSTTTRMAMGDFNADGFGDVTLANVEGSKYRLYPLLSTGVGFTAAPSLVPSWGPLPDDRLAAPDLDGDGLADLLLTRKAGGFSGYAIASGGGYGDRFRFGLLAIPDDPMLGDVDGDGRTDLVNRSNFTAQLGDGQGGFSAPVTAFPTVGCAQPWIVDTDGDGRTDLLCIGSTTNNATPPQRSITISDYSSQYPLRDPHRWMTADLDGDGQDDYVYVYAKNPGVGVLSVLTTGTPRRVPWQVTPTPIMPGLDDSSANRWLVADVGSPGGGADGKSDLVMVDTDGTTLRIYTLLSKGDGTYSERYDFPWEDASGNTVPYTASDLGNFWPIDVNADGETDLVHLVATPTGNGVTVELLLATGNGGWKRHETPAYSFGVADLVGASDFRPMDINGDGLTDLVHTQTSVGVAGTQFRTLVNQGDGSFTPVYSTMAMTYVDVARWLVLDANGDGMTDLVHVESMTSPTGSALALQTVLSRGTGTFELVSPTTASLPASSPDLARGLEATNSLFPADLDGNGITDLLHASKYRDASGIERTLFVQLRNPAANGTTWSAYAYMPGAGLPAAPPWVWRHVRDSARPQSPGVAWIDGNAGVSVFYDIPTDRLARIDNGNGGLTEVSYTPLLGHREYLPSGSLPVVTTMVTRTDVTYPKPIIEQTTYAYDGALWSDALQRTAGFRFIGSRNPDLISMTEYSLEDTCPGMVARVTTSDADTGEVYGYTKNGFTSPGTGPFTCFVQQQSKYGCADGSCRLDSDLVTTLDAYGNVVATVEEIADAPTRLTYAPVDPNEDAYILTFPMYRAEYQKDNNGLTLLSQDLFEYDSNTTYAAKPQSSAEVRRIHHWDSVNGAYVTSELEYYATGMLHRQTSPTGVVTTINYDATYGAFPTVTCDSIGCVTQYWDLALGKERVRYDQNNAATETDYDAHGRAIESRNAAGGWVRTQVLDLGSYVGSTRQRIRQEIKDGSRDGVRWSERYFDGWGRTYRTQAEASGVQITDFDGLTARPLKTSETFAAGSSPQYFTTYDYDGLGRPTTETAPDGSSRSWKYKLGAADVTDELGHTRKLASDGAGRVIRVTETVAGASHDTVYGYDAKGRLVGIVDAAGLITSYYYDTLGQLIGQADPDRGLRQFTYRADGSLETSIDAKGQTISYRYDAAGRPERRTDIDANGNATRTVNWTYDALPSIPTGASIGRIVQIDDNQASTRLTSRFVYDALGRVEEQTDCVDADCRSLRRQFDIAGRLEKLTYPDANGTLGAGAEVVEHSYDDAGRLVKVGNYVTKIEYTVDSRVDTMRYGNKIAAHYTYDPARRWTDTLTIGDSVPLYNATYVRDEAGQLHSLAETAPTNSDSFDYKYDELGRLLSVTSTNSSLDRQYGYDEIGRMTYNSQLGDYHYDDPAHPHAMTRADRGAYRDYDINGNVTKLSDPSGRALKIDWTVDDRPAAIDGSAGSVAMAYDTSGRRVKKTGSSSGTYFNQYVAIENGRLTKYYYAGALLIARDDGARVYYHQDHTHSTRLETDSNGAVVNSYQYDVFGKPIVENETVDDNVGFRSVHGDQELELTYLNARYYDPTTGRFISADSVVRDAYAPQSLDRYAYVENDPVNYHDPSGHMRASIELMKERKQMWRNLMVQFEAGQNECAIGEFCTTGTEFAVVWNEDGSVDQVIRAGNDPSVAQWMWAATERARPTHSSESDHSGSEAAGSGAWDAVLGGSADPSLSLMPNVLVAAWGDKDQTIRRRGNKTLEVGVPINETSTIGVDGALADVKVTLEIDARGKVTADADADGTNVKATTKLSGDLLSVTITKEKGATEKTTDTGGSTKGTDSTDKSFKGSIDGRRETKDDDKTVGIGGGLGADQTGRSSSEANLNFSAHTREQISRILTQTTHIRITVIGQPAPRPGDIKTWVDEDGVTHYYNGPKKR